MKLKYYLRGLGLGVIVAAIVLSFSGKTEELTDAEIKMRATKLGMVEKSVLADIQNDKSNSGNIVKNDEKINEENVDEKENNEFVEDDIMENTQNEEGNIETLKQDEQENNEKKELTEPSEQSKLPGQSETPEKTEDNKEEKDSNKNITEKKEEKVEKFIVISVNPGNGSELISRKLYDAGLVESAILFNRFLVANEYDKILRSGDHEIPLGATEEEMARILCGLD